MSADLIAERLQVAASIGLLVLGAVLAWTSSNVMKRVAGLLLTLLASVLALAALHAPGAALIGGLVIAFATLALGVALLVRLQEAYGGLDVAAFDAADEESEPREPGA